MRIKTLIKHNFSMTIKPLLIYYLFYLVSTMSSSLIDGFDITFTSGYIDGVHHSWTLSIFIFIIFMVSAALTGAQKDTKFLISRSVSRKEIFLTNSLFITTLATIMSVLQIACIYINELISWLIKGQNWRGLSRDVQILQAPDMNNIFIFFMVSLSIYLSLSAVSYLIGSFIARWKQQTIVVSLIISVFFFYCIMNTNLPSKLSELYQFMFIDKSSGIFIIIKHVLLSIIAFATAFPVMRGITAAKPA